MWIAAACLAAVPAQAEPWHIVVNPYFMVPASDGRFGVGNREVGTSSGPADLFRSLNWGFMAAVEIGRDDWAFVLDVNYLNVDVTDDARGRGSVDGHQAAYTALVMKRIDPSAEVYVGVRRADFGVKLACSSACPSPLGPQGSAELSRSRGWTEPLIGMRVRHPLSRKSDFLMMADIGGFSVGSDISVNAWPQISYRVSNRLSGLAGYRIIYVRYDERASGRRFLYDVVTHGPTIGLELGF
jgi:hypothetical protein